MFSVSEKIFQPLVFIAVIFAAFFNISCSPEDSAEMKEEISTGFDVSVYARDKSAFVTWTGFSTEKTVVDFEKVFIEVKEFNSEELNSEVHVEQEDAVVYSEEIADASGKRQRKVLNLENEKEYSVKFTGFIGSQPYSKTINVVPKKISCNFERVTAISAAGKTFISFTFEELEDSDANTNSCPDIKEFNLYDIAGNKLFDYKTTASLAYEKIEIQEDDTKPYCKYYSLLLDEEGSGYELRVLNSKNEESEPLVVTTKKINIPAVNLKIDDFLAETGNLSKFKDKKKLNATLDVFNCEEKIKSAELTIKGRGNSSWKNAPKKSYTIKFKEKQNFLGLGENKSFALVANYFDKTLLRNMTSYELAKNVFDKMPWNPGTKCVQLFINNVYQGVYLAVETIKISGSRVDIPDVSKCDNIDEFEKFGFILEIDSRQDEDFNFETEKNVPFSLKEPGGEDLQPSVKESLQEKIKGKIQAAENAVYSEDFANPESEAYYGKFLDVDSFVDWWLMEELAKNTDSNFYSSCYVYFKPDEKKLFMGPVWDFDLGWGNINFYNPDESYTGFKAEEKITGKEENESGKSWESWILRLRQDENFVKKAKERWIEVKPQVESYFNSEKTEDMSYKNNLAVLNNNEAELNFVRWPILGKSVWKNPAGCEDRKTYGDENKFFTGWQNNRIKWLDEIL